MKRLLSLGALLLAVPLLQALPQDDVTELSEGAAAYKELAKEYGAARNAYYQKLRDIRDDPEALEAPVSPMGEFLPRFIAGAEKYAGTDDAIAFLTWTVENTARSDGDDKAAGDRALATLLDAHIESAALEGFAKKLARLGYSLGADRCRDAIETIVERSPHEEVRLQAMFSRAQLVLRDDASTAADRQLAALDLSEVIQKSSNSGTVKHAEGCLFELENLQIGMVAPDIEGEDLDGVSFKLSDYHGKVVVLDFWGDW